MFITLRSFDSRYFRVYRTALVAAVAFQFQFGDTKSLCDPQPNRCTAYTVPSTLQVFRVCLSLNVYRPSSHRNVQWQY